MIINTLGVLGDSQRVYLLGTAVKVEAIFEDAPDTVSITIRTPSGIKVVDNISMTETIDTLYTSSYQSSISGVEGTYVITIKATKDAFVEYQEGTFSLIRQFMQ